MTQARLPAREPVTPAGEWADSCRALAAKERPTVMVKAPLIVGGRSLSRKPLPKRRTARPIAIPRSPVAIMPNWAKAIRVSKGWGAKAFEAIKPKRAGK